MSTARSIRYWWEGFPAGTVREFGAKRGSAGRC